MGRHQAMSSPTKPLAGIKVVELGTLIAGGTDILYGVTMFTLQLVVVGTIVAALFSARGRTLGAIALVVTVLFNVATVGGQPVDIRATVPWDRIVSIHVDEAAAAQDVTAALEDDDAIDRAAEHDLLWHDIVEREVLVVELRS